MFEDRPWLSSYSPGVPADVPIPPVRVEHALLAAAQRWPDRVAVDFFGATTTYRSLAEQASRAAGVLRGLGVRPGDRVSLVLPNCPAHVAAYYAVLMTGATVVEHNPTYAAAELRDQFALAGSTVAIVWRNRVADVQEVAVETSLSTVISVDLARDLPTAMRLALKLPLGSVRRKRDALSTGDVGDAVDWHGSLTGAAPAAPPDDVGDADDVALVLFTGGTTGVPKGAAITHRNLVANGTQGQAWAGFALGEETVFGMLPFFHAFGMIFCLVLPPMIGATLVAFPNFDAPTVAAAQRRRPATFMPGVAPMFGRMLDAFAASRRPVDTRTVRLAFSGAMPLSAEIAGRWERATGGLLIEGYGMTECSPIALGNPCSPLRRPGSLGIPFPGTEIRVLDQEDPSVVAVADERGVVRGELSVRGPQVFAGYDGRPDETALVLHAEGWLRTGDVVEVDADGFAVLVDRVKEMIVVGGFKVFPSVVEARLRGFPGVADVAVVGIPRGDGTDEDIVAVVVPEADVPRPSLDDLRAYAADHLPHYALPRHLDFVAALPVSMIGKTLRRVVRADYLARSTPPE